MAATRTASLKSSAFFITDGGYSVNNVICRKFSKNLIKIKGNGEKKFHSLCSCKVGCASRQDAKTLSIYYRKEAVCHNSFVAFYVALRARTFSGEAKLSKIINKIK